MDAKKIITRKQPYRRLRQCARGLGMPANAALVVVWLDLQRLRLVIPGRRALWTCRVSTARNGPGERSGSGCTPRGFHEVRDRIGRGEPPGRVFQSRRPTGRVLPPSRWKTGRRDLILSRILRLRGCEAGVNRGAGLDSYRRYIYLHGTNHEAALGRPVSGGCIRLANRNVVKLFNLLEGRPAWCWLGASDALP